MHAHMVGFIVHQPLQCYDQSHFSSPHPVYMHMYSLFFIIFNFQFLISNF